MRVYLWQTILRNNNNFSWRKIRNIAESIKSNLDYITQLIHIPKKRCCKLQHLFFVQYRKIVRTTHW